MKKQKTKTLHLAIPTMGWLNVELAAWTRNNNMSPVYTSRVSPVSKARNIIVDQFLSTKADYLMFIDADTVPPEDAISKLLKLITDGASIATGITPIIRSKGASVNVYQDYSDVEKELTIADMPKEPFPVVGAGASCMIVTREAIEKLEKPYFKTIEFDNGAYCSEDLYFCEQVVKSGGKIMAHPGVICGHLKEIRI